eukprot:1196104-Prorocentrum_minimum.AAC.11
MHAQQGGAHRRSQGIHRCANPPPMKSPIIPIHRKVSLPVASSESSSDRCESNPTAAGPAGRGPWPWPPTAAPPPPPPRPAARVGAARGTREGRGPA